MIFTAIQPFLRPRAFEFWSKHFTVVTITSSQSEGLCTFAMHGYWHAVMTSFGQELLGGRGFSLIPPGGLRAIISINPWLLLPTKFVVAYARKQMKSAIFEWKEKEKGWYLYAGEYPAGWEKKVRVLNLLARKAQCLGLLSPNSPREGMIPLRLVLTSFLMRVT